MAASDLLKELEGASGGVRPAPPPEVLCEVVMLALHDSCSDVVGLGVKCLAPLLRAVHPAQAAPLAKALLGDLRSAEAARREVGLHGLKATLSELEVGPEAAALLHSTLPTLVSTLQDGSPESGGTVEVQAGTLELLHISLQRFAALVDPKLHGLLRAVVLEQLDDRQSVVRKRAVQTLGSLAAALRGATLDVLCADLLVRLRGAGSAEGRRVWLQAVGAVAQGGGARVKGLAEAAPLCVEYCQGAGEGEDELQEAALQALEALVQRIPGGEALGADPSVTNLVLTCAAHDPNYTYSDDEGEGGESGDSGSGWEGSGEEDREGGDGWDSDGYEEDFSDDEDMSWKVRRAAVRLLASCAAMQAGPGLEVVYTAAVPVLGNRLKEREEGVKLEIMQSLSQLVTQAAAEAGPTRSRLVKSAPGLLRRLGREVQAKSVKVRAAAFCLLRSLARAFPDVVSECGGRLYPAAAKAMKTASADTALRLEALASTSTCLQSGVLTGFFDNVGAVCDAAVANVSQRYHKLIVAGLVLIQIVAAVVADADMNELPDDGQAKVAATLHAAVMSRLRDPDVDAEVKICSLQTVAAVVVKIGGYLPAAELENSVLLLVERTSGDGTRIAALQALQEIVASDLRVQLPSAALPILLERLNAFLRKADRELKHNTLALASSMVRQPVSGPAVEAMASMAAPAAALMSDTDLYVASSAMGLFSAVLGSNDAPRTTQTTFAEAALPQSLLLVRSPLLQGKPLKSLQELFTDLSKTEVAGSGFDELIRGLTGKSAQVAESKQVLVTMGKCASAVCQAHGKAVRLAASLLKDLNKRGRNKMEEGQIMGALYCLAELGAASDLSDVSGLDTGIIDHFQSATEGVTNAASYALGRSALGNLPAFLPVLLDHVDDKDSLKYLTLLSVKEVVAGDSAKTLSDEDMAAILECLVKQCGTEEEAAHNVVSECLGRILASHPELALPAVPGLVGTDSALCRVAVASAFKHAFSAVEGAAQSVLEPGLPSLFGLVTDCDRRVQIAALQAVTQGLSVSPGLLRPGMNSLMPSIYDLCRFREDLTREVILGPFKQVEDDGIPLRRTAFVCLDAVLSSCEALVDLGLAVEVVAMGIGDPFDALRCSALTLSDHYSVKLTSHRALRRIVSLRGGTDALLPALVQITEALSKTLSFKPKRDAVNQEIERVEEMKGGALSAALALHADASILESQVFQTFLQEVMSDPALSKKFASLRSDVTAAPAGALPDAMDTA